jgi:hypothetical protein
LNGTTHDQDKKDSNRTSSMIGAPISSRPALAGNVYHFMAAAQHQLKETAQ